MIALGEYAILGLQESQIVVEGTDKGIVMQKDKCYSSLPICY